MEDFFAYRLIIGDIQGVHLSQVHQQCNKSTDITLVHFSLLVHLRQVHPLGVIGHP
jgi:hypothetical protein